MSQGCALIVDDEPDIRELLELTLERMDVESRSAENVAQAREFLSTHRFDLCLTDMRLPDGNGIDLVQHIQQQYPETPVAMITAHGNMESAIQALKAGAFDFVSKPVDLQVLRKLVNTALRLSDRPAPVGAEPAHRLVGTSPAMESVRSTIEKLARSQAPVHISGESGTGKELVARMIHERGPRADMPFVPINCGAIPPDLMESEFFGHKKGSFTGAVTDKAGLFQAADGGTLFLDEIADLPAHMQVKLLRAIQEKSVRTIGSQKETPVDIRVLSATHRDLPELVGSGAFRQDLYYRINVIQLHVPSLRERPEDIPPLAEHILNRLAHQTGQDRPTLTAQATERLQAYSFPGNVRELENILERAIALHECDTVEAGDLQLNETDAGPKALAMDLEMPLPAFLESIEKEAILKALERTRYNKTAAAKLLGISFRALRYRLKKLGLE